VFNGSAWAARAPDADLSFQVIGVEDSGAQAREMAASGQFIGAVRLDGTSGIDGRLYRDGSRRTRAEIELLLNSGTSDGLRLLASVGPNRAVHLYPAPDPGKTAYQIGPGGSILRLDGRPAQPSDRVAGQWARLGSAAAPGGLYGYGGLLFIETCAWQGGVVRV